METKQPNYFSEMIAEMNRGNSQRWDTFLEGTLLDAPLEGIHTVIGLTALAYLARYNQCFDDLGGSRGD